MLKKIKPYIIGIAIPLLVGGLSAWLTKDGMENHSGLNQPPLTPPMWLFPIVWSALYILMGIGSVLVWKRGGPKAAFALKIYASQLGVNFFWSIIFFNIKAFLFAFVWLLLLWAIIAIMIYAFRRLSPAAGWMQLPYLLWVTFAGYLTFMTYLLNR